MLTKIYFRDVLIDVSSITYERTMKVSPLIIDLNKKNMSHRVYTSCTTKLFNKKSK